MKQLILILLITVAASANASTCRSQAVKHHFDVLNGYPHRRSGYVVDHICALEQGGLDAVINMQYQTIAEGHIKDRIELTPAGKAKWCNSTNSTPTRQVFNCKSSREN